MGADDVRYSLNKIIIIALSGSLASFAVYWMLAHNFEYLLPIICGILLPVVKLSAGFAWVYALIVITWLQYVWYGWHIIGSRQSDQMRWKAWQVIIVHAFNVIFGWIAYSYVNYLLQYL